MSMNKLHKGGLIENTKEKPIILSNGICFVNEETYQKYGKKFINKLNGSKNGEVYVNE